MTTYQVFLNYVRELHKYDFNFSVPPVNTISKQQFSEVSLQDR